MVKDIWDSFKDNLKERTTNPFLGTFIVVWIIRNHRVVYALFNFDKEYYLESKLDFIAFHYPKCDFFYNLLSTIGITFLVLVGTYILLFISRMLTDSYHEHVIPWGARFINKSSIVLRADYDLANEKIENLKEQLKAQRALRIQAEEERDAAEKKNNVNVFENKRADVATKEAESDNKEVDSDELEAIRNENEMLRQQILKNMEADNAPPLILPEIQVFDQDNENIKFNVYYDILSRKYSLSELSSRLEESMIGIVPLNDPDRSFCRILYDMNLLNRYDGKYTISDLGMEMYKKVKTEMMNTNDGLKNTDTTT